MISGCCGAWEPCHLGTVVPCGFLAGPCTIRPWTQRPAMACPGTYTVTDGTWSTVVPCSGHGVCTGRPGRPVCREQDTCDVACMCDPGYGGSGCGAPTAQLATTQQVPVKECGPAKSPFVHQHHMLLPLLSADCHGVRPGHEHRVEHNRGIAADGVSPSAIRTCGAAFGAAGSGTAPVAAVRLPLLSLGVMMTYWLRVPPDHRWTSPPRATC